MSIIVMFQWYFLLITNLRTYVLDGAATLDC